jgi:hypothetical protein
MCLGKGATKSSALAARHEHEGKALHGEERVGSTAEQGGSRRTLVRVCGHRLDRKSHQLCSSGVCMQVCVRMQNAGGAVMATAHN